MEALDGNIRLDQALSMLGYNEGQPSHHRGNLLRAIELFAAMNHDEPLVYACQARFNMIRAESDARGTERTYMLNRLRGSAPRYQKMLGGVLVGVIAGSVGHFAGLPPLIVNATAAGLAAGLAFGL